MSELIRTKTIISGEAGEMMGMEHSKLFKKIDGTNLDFTKSQLGFSEYWTESQYQDSTGRTLREYQVIKKGR